jgi:hypothetical protein
MYERVQSHPAWLGAPCISFTATEREQFTGGLIRDLWKWLLGLHRAES